MSSSSIKQSSFSKFALLVAALLSICFLGNGTVEAQIAPLPGAIPATIDQIPVPPLELPSIQGSSSRQPAPHLHDATLQNFGALSNPIRVKDITMIEGHRSNRVTGIGLVTGLKGTGGRSGLTRDTVLNMLRKFDILATEAPTGSTSVVAVTAEIPPFIRPGEKIKATISVVDDASGLFGGVLQTTELKGFDGRVYAVANGAVVLSGFSAEGDGAGITQNHDTTGKVQAQIEVGMQTEPAFPRKSFRLLLTNKDYATAQRIAAEINYKFPGHAYARDQGSVDVVFPNDSQASKLDFVVKINELSVIPDMPARVVVNQKTGTIVVGQHVKLSHVVFANENLVITTSEAPIAVQPAPFSEGQTAVLPRTQVTATETGGRFNLLRQQATVGDLAAMLNMLGVRPRDLISILQDIQASGALQAQLIIQ